MTHFSNIELLTLFSIILLHDLFFTLFSLNAWMWYLKKPCWRECRSFTFMKIQKT